MEKARSGYRALAEASRRDLRTLTQDREKVVAELRRLQEENDMLVGKHSTLAETMQAEDINLPERTEDMQLLLLTLREDLITAKVGKERAEERLVGEVGLLRGQLVGEQQGREAMEAQLSGEVESLRQRLGEAGREREVLVKEREQEKERRRATERELRQVVERQSGGGGEVERLQVEEMSQTITQLRG